MMEVFLFTNPQYLVLIWPNVLPVFGSYSCFVVFTPETNWIVSMNEVYVVGEFATNTWAETFGLLQNIFACQSAFGSSSDVWNWQRLIHDWELAEASGFQSRVGWMVLLVPSYWIARDLLQACGCPTPASGSHPSPFLSHSCSPLVVLLSSSFDSHFTSLPGFKFAPQPLANTFHWSRSPGQRTFGVIFGLFHQCESAFCPFPRGWVPHIWHNFWYRTGEIPSG